AEPRLFPAKLLRLKLDAAEARPRFLPAMEAVEISVAMDARVVMVGHDLVAVPQLRGAILAQLEQQGAGFVTCGEKRRVAEDKRRGGVDRGVDAGPPRHLEMHLPRRRIEDHHAAASE